MTTQSPVGLNPADDRPRSRPTPGRAPLPRSPSRPPGRGAGGDLPRAGLPPPRRPRPRASGPLETVHGPGQRAPARPSQYSSAGRIDATPPTGSRPSSRTQTPWWRLRARSSIRAPGSCAHSAWHERGGAAGLKRGPSLLPKVSSCAPGVTAPGSRSGSSSGQPPGSRCLRTSRPRRWSRGRCPSGTTAASSRRP
jgi:hypothetical protein